VEPALAAALAGAVMMSALLARGMLARVVMAGDPAVAARTRRAFLAAAVLALSPALASAPAPGPPAGWAWPMVPRPAVLRAFDPPARPWLAGHRGVDLAAAYDGAPVTSPASGTVSFVGVVVDRPVITVDHGHGLRSSFEPVVSSLETGAAVAAGEVLGHVQSGHCGPEPCVHWGMRRGGEYVNPLAFVLDLRPSVLLPLLRSPDAAPR
jgi:murein DD-endopeptidase MepM/ murein hydrolase activator NlpD